MSKSSKQMIAPAGKPLDPKLLNDIALSFQKNDFEINLFDEFLIFLRIIPGLDGERNVNHCMQELFGEMTFDSKDEVQAFSETYTLFYNSTVQLLNEMEDIKNERDQNFDGLIQLFRSLLMISGYTGKEAAEIIREELFDRIGFIMEEAGIDLGKPKNFIPVIEKKLGEDYVHILDILVAGAEGLEKRKSSSENSIDGLLAIIISSSFFNIMRKESFSGNEPQLTADIISTSSQAGRNDPCPCGSGKKYKKCCMEKEQNPLSVLESITPLHGRLTDEEINQFYEVYAGFASFAQNTYTENKSDTPLFSLAPNGTMSCNPELLQQPELIDKLHQVISKNKKTIVSDYLKTEKTGKAVESIIKRWNRVIYAEFFIMEKSSCGAAFFWDTKKNVIYHVYGLYDNIMDILPPPPVMAKTLLLPFKGRIIYSGVLSRTNIQIGESMARELNAQYVKVRQEKPVILEL